MLELRINGGEDCGMLRDDVSMFLFLSHVSCRRELTITDRDRLVVRAEWNSAIRAAGHGRATGYIIGYRMLMTPVFVHNIFWTCFRHVSEGHKKRHSGRGKLRDRPEQ